jgi:hypothetical protein
MEMTLLESSREERDMSFNSYGRDLNKLKEAAVIVLASSGDRVTNETHALFPKNLSGKDCADADMAYLKGFDELMTKGIGMVVFHYATWVNNETGRKYYLDWLGGYYKANHSKHPVDNCAMTPRSKAGNHPILRGVKPWTYNEESLQLKRSF